jgi:hypothetical protein
VEDAGGAGRWRAGAELEVAFALGFRREGRFKFRMSVPPGDLTPLYFDDLAVGARYRTGSIEVTAEEIVAFARRYDPQPFHIGRAASALPRNVGARLIPSRGRTGLPSRSRGYRDCVTSTTVAMMSMMWAGSRTQPPGAATCPGQWTMNGVRIPPWCVKCL